MTPLAKSWSNCVGMYNKTVQLTRQSINEMPANMKATIEKIKKDVNQQCGVI